MFKACYAPATGFYAWNQEHWIWLLYGLVSTIFWITFAKRAQEHHQPKIGLWMGLVGVISWVYSVLVMFATDQAPAQSVIPLHLCYFLNLLLPFILWKRWMHWMDWIYPIVIAGCLQALFTPDLTQPFPHYYNVRYWLVHIMLIQSVLFAIFVYGFRPTPAGIIKCIVAMNAFALFVTPFNLLLDTNFLYLREPAPGSIMEVLGPWPQYIFVLEGLMIIFFGVVYLPFGIHSFVKKRRATVNAVDKIEEKHKG